MAEHPAVAFLLAAHQQAEELARVGTPGPWEPEGDDPTDDEVFTVHDGEHGDLVGCTVASVRSGMLTPDPGRTQANMQLIASFADPTAVLRRVAAERKILAEHKLVKISGYDAYGAAMFDACQICGRGGYTPGPCRTVLGLAEAWGWQGTS